MIKILPYQPDFNALRPDDALFSILIMQPRGQLHASPQGVSNADQKVAVAKTRRFFETAVQTNADLVLTPEYCCPWQCIEQVVLAGSFPQPHKLWVIGCESINRDELRTLIANHPGFDWQVDEAAFTNAGHFFDPVCYFFINPAVQEKRQVVAIQFKSQPMADHDVFLERDNMIPGTERYVLQNNDTSVCLTTLICSDALGFTLPALGGDYLHRPYLILHPQLNKDPRHNQFRNYRGQAYMYASLSKEFLCYNWARATDIAGAIHTEFGGTALYTKSRDITCTDERIAGNHSLGMYYTFCPPYRSTVFFVNFDEHMFHFRTTKVSQEAAVAALGPRTGPDMVGAWNWDSNTEHWVPAQCDDGFMALCSTIGTPLSPLDNAALTALEKERLLALTSANLEGTKRGPWWELPQVASFHIKEDEVINRATVVQDPDLNAADARCRLLTRYRVLAGSIITDPSLYPASIADLAGTATLTYPIPGKPDCNLGAEGKTPATVAYVGAMTSPFAKNKFDGMFRSISEESRRRLVVWYSDQNKFENESTLKRRIDDNLTEDPSSIVKDM